MAGTYMCVAMHVTRDEDGVMGSRTHAILVTGAAKRLGGAIATQLAQQGHAVALHANRSIAQAEALAAELRQSGFQAVALQADLTDSRQTSDLIARASAEIGPLDGLINSASVFLDDEAAHFDPESYDAHFDVHVRAPMILGAAFAAQVPDDRSGSIINIIDQRVWALTPRFFSYTLSKAALWTMTQTMAQAFAPKIRVNAIGPGPTLKSERQAPEDFQAQVESLPLGRGPALDEFGRTIRFLFDTPSITGQMIALDGGQHLIWRLPGEAEIQE